MYFEDVAESVDLFRCGFMLSKAILEGGEGVIDVEFISKVVESEGGVAFVKVRKERDGAVVKGVVGVAPFVDKGDVGLCPLCGKGARGSGEIKDFGEGGDSSHRESFDKFGGELIFPWHCPLAWCCFFRRQLL